MFLADMQTTYGSDTADLHWWSKGLSRVEVKVAEEQSQESDTTHAAEVVGCVVLK